MSPTPLTPAQDQTIGNALSRVAPPGWTAVDLTIVCAGPETRGRLRIRMPDGRVVKGTGPVPRDVTRLLRELREQAYRPGVGTWFTAHVVVEAAGRIGIDFDHDNPPPLEPAPNSWADELVRFPRDAAHTPAWLRQYASGETSWMGARWQVEFRAADVSSPTPATLDATTSQEAHEWAVAVVARLDALGIEAGLGQDQGEDGRGNPTVYDELLVTVGSGHMALAFWRDVIAWTVDVLPDQVDREAFVRVAGAAVSVVQQVSGYVLDVAGLGAYERGLLGR